MILIFLFVIPVLISFPAQGADQTHPASAPVLIISYWSECLLGVFQEQTWTPIKSREILDRASSSFTAWNFTKKRGEFQLALNNSIEDIFDKFSEKILAFEANSYINLVNGTWNAIPRPILIDEVDHEPLNLAIRKFLQSKGYGKSEPRINELYTVDLNGDSQPENLILASDYVFEDFKCVSGSYFLFMFHTASNGKDIFTSVWWHFGKMPEADDPGGYIEDTQTLSILGILDLNGDGTMEIIIYKPQEMKPFVNKAEFSPAESWVYEMKNMELKRVLEADEPCQKR